MQNRHNICVVGGNGQRIVNLNKAKEFFTINNIKFSDSFNLNQLKLIKFMNIKRGNSQGS